MDTQKKPLPDFSFTAAQDYARLDSYLCQVCPQFSRSYFKKMIEDSRVSINGIPALKASLPIKATDHVEITLPSKPEKNTRECSIQGVSIIHEHEHFLIINKPAGLVVHKAHTNDTEPNLVDWLLVHMPEIATIGSLERPGIVHRLDKDTSGLMVVARTHYGHSRLSDLFKNRKIEKKYVAVVEGHPAQSGSVDLPIGRHPVHKHKMTTFDHVLKHGQRTAMSNYQVITYFAQHSLVEIKPVTGRTHQIRVHMTALGHPLIGDKTYNPKLSLPFARHALHAQQLSFTFDQELFDFKQELPVDIQELVARLKPSSY